MITMLFRLIAVWSLMLFAVLVSTQMLSGVLSLLSLLSTIAIGAYATWLVAEARNAEIDEEIDAEYMSEQWLEYWPAWYAELDRRRVEWPRRMDREEFLVTERNEAFDRR